MDMENNLIDVIPKTSAADPLSLTNSSSGDGKSAQVNNTRTFRYSRIHMDVEATSERDITTSDAEVFHDLKRLVKISTDGRFGIGTNT